MNETWMTCAQNGTIINITVTVTDDDVEFVNISLNDTSTDYNLTYLGAAWANLTNIPGTNTWYNNSINVSAEADGTYNLTINATDTDGNWNNTENVTVYVDNAIPSVSQPGVIYITDYGNNNWSANGTQVRINVTVADLGVAGIYNLWVNVSNITEDPDQGWIQMTNNSGNWTTVNITVNAVTGVYEIWFNATDNASNSNTAMYTTVNIDNIEPNVTLSGYYNVTGTFDGTGNPYDLCTNMTNLSSGGWGEANHSVRNNDTVMLFVHVNDTTSDILYNASGKYWYIMAYVNFINASQYWVEMQNTTADKWNFTVNVTIGDTIKDGNQTQ